MGGVRLIILIAVLVVGLLGCIAWLAKLEHDKRSAQGDAPKSEDERDA
jgi:hypothetical protein